MRRYTVRDGTTGDTLLVYQHDTELVFDQWPGCTQTFVEVDSPVVPVYTGSWRITRYAFRNRFTEDEKTDIEIAALDVPTAPTLNRRRAAALRVWMQDILAADNIDLQMAAVRDGLTKLEQFGLLAAGRATAIGDAVPDPSELAE